MGKTTKQMSAETGESGTDPVMKQAASLKMTANKADTKSPGSRKTASTKKAVTAKSTTKKTAAKKAVSKKAAAKKTATKKPASGKTTTKKAAPGKAVASGTVEIRHISSDERRRMIAEVAYLRAESQGFLSDEREDWLFAEAEVDRLLIGVDVGD